MVSKGWRFEGSVGVRDGVGRKGDGRGGGFLLLFDVGCLLQSSIPVVVVSQDVRPVTRTLSASRRYMMSVVSTAGPLFQTSTSYLHVTGFCVVRVFARLCRR